MGCNIDTYRVKLIDDVSISSTTSTSEWWDVRDAADIKVEYEQGDSGDDVDINVDLSPQRAAVLNKLDAAGTSYDDYERHQLNSSLTGETRATYGEDDVADLGQPMVSARIYLDGTATNASAWLIVRT